MKSINDSWRMDATLRAAVRSFAWCTLSLLACVFATPLTARAHPDLDQAVASAEEAEFDVALAGFERALASGELTRDELVTLLHERSLVLHALGQRGALRWDLATLAMLEPGRDLGRRAPPELVAAFSEAASRQGAAVTISASCTVASTGMQVVANVSDLPDPSLAHVRLRTRKDQGPETMHEASDVEVAVNPGETLEYSAELVGLGNVVFAQAGSASDPKVCEAPNLDGSSAGGAGTDRQDGKNRKLWWWVGAGSVVAITAVTVGIVLANKSDEPSKDTPVGRPVVSFK